MNGNHFTMMPSQRAFSIIGEEYAAKNQGVTLDELSKGKLPEHLLQSIGELKLTTRELEDWAESQQPFYLGVKMVV